MQRSISKNARQLCRLASCLALATAANNAAAGTVQYSCITTADSYIHSKQSSVTATSSSSTLPAAQPRHFALNGFPILVLPPRLVPPLPVGGTVSTVLLAPTNKILPMSINKATPQGMFYTPAELAFWKNRTLAGPFRTDNDFAKGTPGDWKRIVGQAEGMANGTLHETLTNAINPDFGNNGTPNGGILALDTAFAFLVTNDVRYLNAAKTWLLKTVSDPANDISKRCYVVEANDGVNPPIRTYTDGFLEAQWVNRTVMTYDFLKHGMTDSERITVEAVLLKWGYFLGAHMQWGLEYMFPNRAANDYTPAQRVKNWSGDPFTKRIADTNHDCLLDAKDDQKSVTVRGFVDSSGIAGPSLSTLSLYYNNRRSNEALSISLIGLLLHEPKLVDEAKRYVTEWLSYSVWSDGTQGEYQRNGDYCIPQQGLIYGSINSAAALAIADGMARTGDNSLYMLKVNTGMFGTESAPGTSKSLLTPVTRHLNLLSGRAQAYFFERDVTVQNPRPATSLGNQESHFFNNVQPLDNYHDLSYLISNRYYRQQAIRDEILRIPQPGLPVQPFPGSTGHPVSGWAGASTIFPAILFMYAEVPPSIWPYPFTAGSVTYQH